MYPIGLPNGSSDEPVMERPTRRFDARALWRNRGETVEKRWRRRGDGVEKVSRNDDERRWKSGGEVVRKWSTARVNDGGEAVEKPSRRGGRNPERRHVESRRQAGTTGRRTAEDVAEKRKGRGSRGGRARACGKDRTSCAPGGRVVHMGGRVVHRGWMGRAWRALRCHQGRPARPGRPSPAGRRRGAPRPGGPAALELFSFSSDGASIPVTPQA